MSGGVVSREIKSRINSSISNALKRIGDAVGKPPPPFPIVIYRPLGWQLAEGRWSVIYDPFSQYNDAGEPLPKSYWKGKVDRSRGYLLVINPDFLKDDLTFVLTVSVPHEIAHIAAVHYFGHNVGKGHGLAWREMMKHLGVDSERIARGLGTCEVRRRNAPAREIALACMKVKPHEKSP